MSHWVQMGEIPAMPRSHRSRSRQAAATSARDGRSPNGSGPDLPGSGTKRLTRAAEQSGSTVRTRKTCRHGMSSPSAPPAGTPSAVPTPSPEKDTPCKAVRRRGGCDDGSIVSEVHPLGKAGQQARHGQNGQCAGQPRDQRRPGHQQDADDQDPFPPESVAEESRRHLHGDIPVEEYREQKAALRMIQAELRHDGVEQRREGHADDVVADPAEDQKRPHGVVGLPEHGGRSDQARSGGCASSGGVA
jgi:hypothetical protein